MCIPTLSLGIPGTVLDPTLTRIKRLLTFGWKVGWDIVIALTYIKKNYLINKNTASDSDELRLE